MILLVVGSFITAHLAFWLIPNVFEPWNAQAVDQLFRFRAASERFRLPYDDTIVHVDLNDSSIRRLNDFNLDRSAFARVIQNLSRMQVAVQAYDFVFPARSSTAEDTALIEATAAAGNVYFGLAFAALGKGPASCQASQSAMEIPYLERTKWHARVLGDPCQLPLGSDPLPTFSDLASATRGLGYLNVKFDRDGVYRRVPLLVRVAGGFYPSFPFRVICDYLGVPPAKIMIEPGKHIILQDARRPGEATAHDIVIPIDRHGNMVINYIGAWERMHHYSLADILLASNDRDELEMWGEELAGKLVIVSDVSTGASDIGTVATDINFPLSGLHANVMHTILTENFLRQLSERQMLLIEGLLLLMVLLLSYWFSSLPFSLGTLVMAGGYLGAAGAAFMYGHVIVNVIRPLLMMFLAAGALIAYRYIHEEREKQVLKKSLEAYFPPSVVQKIMVNPAMLTTSGQKKELTILFSDIKSFTTHSAAMVPELIQDLLNEYFEAMVDIVFKYEGTVDKFIGDGLMVFFGDPEKQPDHALRCVRTAIEMQQKVRQLKADWEKQGHMPLQVRVGINTGTVVVGNMGSARRLSYTVIGSDVNLAQRLESNAPVGGIMISQRTYELVKAFVPTRPLGQIQVKGLSEYIAAYEVLVDEKPAN
jgi:adenylate cyclase